MKELLSKYGLQMICLGPILAVVGLAFVIAGLEQMAGKEIGYWFREKEIRHDTT